MQKQFPWWMVPSPPADSGCAVASWKGDAYCDDINNTPECDYDGGDCCGPNVNTWFCDACECLDPNGVAVSTMPPATTEDPFTTWINAGGCTVLFLKGDGMCHDFNNTPECDYDGGDCCGPNVNTITCSACECLEP